jgi:catechol 2,3-dioxygenase-like lactoylglutathione lyase family enzyme
MLPAEDIERAKAFYTQVLGLPLAWQTGRGIAVSAGHGSMLYIYIHPRTTADHTAVRFAVTDVEALVAQLRQCGVAFEEYDLPDFKTVNGIVTNPHGAKAAWFKDTEGNLLSMVQTEGASAG